MKHFSTEELVARWEAHNAIANLMGRLAYFDMLYDAARVFDEFWSKKEDVSLAFSGGCYKGVSALSGFYGALGELNLLRAQVAKRLHPEELGHRADGDLAGVGGLKALNLTTPVVEIAEDGKTAKGLWYFMAGEVDHYTPAGPAARSRWGRMGVDFVKEPDGWKLWHVVAVADFDAAMGTSWASGERGEAGQDSPGYAELSGFRLPEPNLPFPMPEPYGRRRRLARFPRIPKPYATFGDTFSYGEAEH